MRTLNKEESTGLIHFAKMTVGAIGEQNFFNLNLIFYKYGPSGVNIFHRSMSKRTSGVK